MIRIAIDIAVRPSESSMPSTRLGVMVTASRANTTAPSSEQAAVIRPCR